MTAGPAGSFRRVSGTVCKDGPVLRIWRVVRAGAVAAVIAAAGVGCTSSDAAPDPAPTVSATTMRGALLQPQDIGAVWKASPREPLPNPLPRLCAGESAAPAVLGTPEILSSPLVDEGSAGVQTFDQVALVYADQAGALAAQAALRAVADTCPPSVTQAAQDTEERREPAYSETAAVAPLSSGGWSGFVMERHKVYDPKNPAAADTAVAVLRLRNVVLVDAYAVYRLKATGAAPAFANDWRNLVGTTLARVS